MTPPALQLVVPRQRAPEGTLRLAQLAAGVLPYRLVRQCRRTIAIKIEHEGVVASAPLWVALGDIENFIRLKERWIRARLAESSPPPHFEWRDGARLAWLGGEIALCPDPALRGVVLDGDRLRVGLAPNAPALREQVLAWVRQQALALYCERARLLAPALGVTPPPIRLSNARTQWGSCSASGRVLLCWRLAQLPLHLVDYVVTHELAHLKELNHSPRFWALVARLCPDYAATRKELNDLGKRLPIL